LRNKANRKLPRLKYYVAALSRAGVGPLRPGSRRIDGVIQQMGDRRGVEPRHARSGLGQRQGPVGFDIQQAAFHQRAQSRFDRVGQIVARNVDGRAAILGRRDPRRDGLFELRTGL
jgi:hypothetical protein